MDSFQINYWGTLQIREFYFYANQRKTDYDSPSLSEAHTQSDDVPAAHFFTSVLAFSACNFFPGKKKKDLT